MKLLKEEEEAIAKGFTFYTLQAVGVFAYMTAFNDPIFTPNNTVGKLMSNFSIRNPDFNFRPRQNQKMGTISYRFTDRSLKPPGASSVPQPIPFTRSITDLQSVANATTVWQYYRSAICQSDNGSIFFIRLFNTPPQQGYQDTKVSQNVDLYVPKGLKILGYRVVWRAVAIVLSQAGFEKRSAELVP